MSPHARFYAGVGSRETPMLVRRLMGAFAYDAHRLGWTLRSGGADGADTAFEENASGRAEIYLPWAGFNGRASTLFPTLDAFKIAAKFHPAWDRCTFGARKLHARNVHQVLGHDCKTPSRFVICWTIDGKASGGTGQAIRIAQGHGIAVFNLYCAADLDAAYAALEAA